MSRTGKYLISLLMESLLTGLNVGGKKKKIPTTPPRSRVSLVCNEEGCGHDRRTGLYGFGVPCYLVHTAWFVKSSCTLSIAFSLGGENTGPSGIEPVRMLH